MKEITLDEVFNLWSNNNHFAEISCKINRYKFIKHSFENKFAEYCEYLKSKGYIII